MQTVSKSQRSVSSVPLDPTASPCPGIPVQPVDGDRARSPRRERAGADAGSGRGVDVHGDHVVEAVDDPASYYRGRDRINPVVWQRADMRSRLAVRDIGGVFKLLQRFGVPQRAIAARTGQSQSEVSEIICGRRLVHRYELLERIAEGLGVPRGWMGLAYDDATAALLATSRKVVGA